VAKLKGSGPGHTSGEDWSDAEVKAAVDEYLTMLRSEAVGQQYSKSDHRRTLSQKLRPERTSSAIEFKHQNISAAMLELGLPYIRGYKPRGNYQAALLREIQHRMEEDPRQLASLRAEPQASAASSLQRAEPPSSTATNRKGTHLDYGLLQEENSRLGAMGEELVVEFERKRLRRSGQSELVDHVRWASRDDGDGLGYDVLSFDEAGRERYIEVKTTALGPEAPFYISSAELHFARCHLQSFVLYRVFCVLDSPRFFVLEGDIADALNMVPVTYRAQLRAGTRVGDHEAEAL
jgi:hypothetical protein